MSVPQTFPIKRVLIANRGEIAVRIIRACRELGIETVAIYSEGEAEALHVRGADDAYLLPGGSGLSYLNGPAIIEIAIRSGAAAVHPGYGFLAENAEFADACSEAGLVFVGPSGAAIRVMGDKVAARALAIEAGVPVVPGSDGQVQSVVAARAWADEHGFPVAVKAAAGGGGRGFRVAKAASGLENAFTGAIGEAVRYFANPAVYLERYLERPRHIEVQIFADNHSNVVWLGERDCSVQRRHQKLVEETPSPAVDQALREALGKAAEAMARAANYRNAGTCEFMLTGDGEFYFLEMNTRIQVEHTITEEVTGIDLVKEQLRVAADLPLSFTQESVVPRGHAIECRINAEDAGRDFKPSPGTVTLFRPPDGPGVRVDSAVEDGVSIPPSYDSLIAKLVAWGRNREEALNRMNRALGEFRIEGVPTLIPFHLNVISHPVFRAGEATTAFLPEHPEVIPPPQEIAATKPAGEDEVSRLVVEVDGRRLVVQVHGLAASDPAPERRQQQKKAPVVHGHASNRTANATQLLSPIQGAIVRVPASLGASVSQGDLICVIEAMKMENEIVAHRAGAITSLSVSAGESVKIGSVLATIE